MSLKRKINKSVNMNSKLAVATPEGDAEVGQFSEVIGRTCPLPALIQQW